MKIKTQIMALSRRHPFFGVSREELFAAVNAYRPHVDWTLRHLVGRGDVREFQDYDGRQRYSLLPGGCAIEMRALEPIALCA